MENSLHNVGDLSADARSVIESVVGHALRSDEVLYIATIGPKAEAPASERSAAWEELESIIAEMQQHASKSGLSSEQLDELIDAECAAQRYGQPE